MFKTDIAVVGGAGRAGLPLGLAFVKQGLRVALYDHNDGAVALINAGEMPFWERGAQSVRERAVRDGSLRATGDPAVLSDAHNLIVTIETPVSGYLTPNPHEFLQSIKDLSDRFVDGQLLILRSTVYPGVTRLVERLIEDVGLDIGVAFCPERIAEGNALEELETLPQIVAARDRDVAERAQKLFCALTDRILMLTPEEAELAKLFNNAWRYALFAVSNQFFMIANDFGQDFERIRVAMTTDYPRAKGLPSAGFAAGPCLFKDTMQLAAFNNHNSPLGHAAMAVNEGIPLYLVSKLEIRYDLSNLTVGLLGMAYKPDSDDSRSSLSYKLDRILSLKAKRVLCTDPYIKTDSNLTDLQRTLDESDLLVLCVPHAVYRELKVEKPVVDIWGVLGRGTVV